MDLPAGGQWDVTGRYVGTLPNPSIPSYWAFDSRLAWPVGDWEFALVGQNLADPRHPEFGGQQIRRSVYGKVTVRW